MSGLQSWTEHDWAHPSTTAPPPRLSLHNLLPAGCRVPTADPLPDDHRFLGPPARGALLDARNQEKAANSGCQDAEAPMVALALPSRTGEAEA
jgi:hypothetical protein